MCNVIHAKTNAMRKMCYVTHDDRNPQKVSPVFFAVHACAERADTRVRGGRFGRSKPPPYAGLRPSAPRGRLGGGCATYVCAPFRGVSLPKITINPRNHLHFPANRVIIIP